MRSALLAVLLAGVAMAPMAAAQAGCKESGTLTLQPGAICHPLPLSLRKGQALVYDWRVMSPAGGTLDFSTHIHLGPELVNLSEEVSSGKSGRLVADRDGLYSILWDNQGDQAVTYTYSLGPERQGQAKTPVPWWIVIAGAAMAAGLARRR